MYMYIIQLSIFTHVSIYDTCHILLPIPTTNSQGWRFGFVIDGSDKIWRPLVVMALGCLGQMVVYPLVIHPGGKHVENPRDFSGWFSDWHRCMVFSMVFKPPCAFFSAYFCSHVLWFLVRFAGESTVHLSPSNKLFTFEVVCCKTVAPWRFSGRFFSWSFCDIWKDDERCSIKSGWSVQAWQESNCTSFFSISAANFGFVTFISD